MNKRRPWQILVVDDDDNAREFIAEALEQLGFKVLKAGGGREALAIFDKNPVDVVLSDVRMGGGDGIFLLAELRKRHASRPLVFLMSGFFADDNIDAKRLGAQGAYSKPLDLAAVGHEILAQLSILTA